MLTAAAAVVLGGALLLVVAGQALVASQQVHLDSLASSLQQATVANENLELAKAQLSTPVQVLQFARRSLHMVTPPQVTYLPPVAAGESVLQANSPRSR